MRHLPKPRDPFAEMERLFRDFFPSQIGMFRPDIDLYEKKNDLIVEVPLAGVDAEDVNIAIEDNVLAIEGKTEKKTEVDEKDYYRKEVRAGSFYRAVALPVKVEENKAKAESANGILTITIPKASASKNKAVKVKVAKAKNKGKK